MARKGESSSAESASTIGFRLEPELRKVLDGRAALFNVSSHALARQYVIEGLLSSEERQQMHDSIATLRKEIKELRGEFSLAVQTLLVSAGKVAPTLAEDWVQANFNLS